MNRQNWSKQLLCLGLALILLLALAACQGQAVEQDTQPPSPTLTPTEAPAPTLAPTPEPTPTPPIPYMDVLSDAGYYDAVVWAYKNGITSDGTAFKPDAVCTRAELIEFIWRAMGSPSLKAAYNPFGNVSSDDWFYESALWAYRNDVIPGATLKVDAGGMDPASVISSDMTFNSNDPCTNGQALTFLWRAEGRPMAVTVSDEYYARAVAWAENGGMFAWLDSVFDPDAPCTRASLMTYLYWAVEQWSYSEEDKAVQAEYEQVIDEAILYDLAHYLGLVYADYVDVEGDGKLELLTVGFDNFMSTDDITVAVYANIDGHARKICEKTFYTYGGYDLFTCRTDGQLYLCHHVFSGDLGETYDYYKIENGAFISCGQATFMYRGDNTDSDIAMIEKYTLEKELFDTRSYQDSDRGLLPSAEGYYAASEKYWLYYWAESDPLYVAALNGDFSAFAGNYEDKSGQTGDITFSKDGIVTGGSGYFTGQKPFTIDVGKNGEIRCYVGGKDTGYGIWTCEEVYRIYPVGISYPYSQSDDPSQIRIHCEWPMSKTGVYSADYVKVS